MDKTINVLIVDDYRTMLRIIRNLLKQLDFNNVEEATDGAEALAKLRAGNFGLVISDWNMQPMTGLDLLREVRADARLARTPFIMVTAESKTENVIAAKEAGVNPNWASRCSSRARASSAAGKVFTPNIGPAATTSWASKRACSVATSLATNMPPNGHLASTSPARTR